MSDEECSSSDVVSVYTAWLFLVTMQRDSPWMAVAERKVTVLSMARSGRKAAYAWAEDMGASGARTSRTIRSMGGAVGEVGSGVECSALGDRGSPGRCDRSLRTAGPGGQRVAERRSCARALTAFALARIPKLLQTAADLLRRPVLARHLEDVV